MVICVAIVSASTVRRSNPGSVCAMTLTVLSLPASLAEGLGAIRAPLSVVIATVLGTARMGGPRPNTSDGRLRLCPTHWVAKGLTVVTDPKDYVFNDDASISDVDLDREKIYFQGERLTEGRAEQIAETALRDARRRGLIPGRKSLSGGNTHSPRLEVRVPAGLHREITERAKRENVTVSKLVREILQRYVDEQAA